MRQKKMVRRIYVHNQFRFAVIAVLILVFYLTISHVVQFSHQRIAFKKEYLRGLETQNEILVQYLALYLEQTTDEKACRDSLFTYIQEYEQEQVQVWAYVAYDDIVHYYRSNDLMKAQATFQLQGFKERLQENGMYVVENSFVLRGSTITVGLVAREKSVLREWGYSDSKAYLLLQSVIVSFLLAIISLIFIWRTRNHTKKIEEYKEEQLRLNRRIEGLNQKQTQQIIEEERNKNRKSSLQIGTYDKDLVSILIRKAVQREALPIAIIDVTFNMGQYYYSRQKMSELKEKMQIDRTLSYELFEIGKGEFVYLFIRPGEENWTNILHYVKQKVEEIARVNEMTATVKEQLITK
ncbi:hypothetical protein [Anaerosporobacter faecicola]|uniref:hypothetical protein n=1 Tax=Anaerosporobacter faecicola TaxID=2718714 RepID=UPI001438DE1D|nr:hypothetical protein [Anaerosporobacter faecicola]